MKKWFQLCLTAVFAIVCMPLFCACVRGQANRSRYEITAEYDPAHQTVTGVVKLTFENPTENELSALEFQLYPNAYRENALYSAVYSTEEKTAYYDGKSHGGITVTSVSGAKGWQITGEDENILTATLTQSLYPGESVVLDLGFTVTLPKINHRFGVGQDAVALSRFFPVLCGVYGGAFVQVTPSSIGEPYVLDSAEYKLSLTLPKEYVPVSSCEVQILQTLESKTVYLLTGDSIRNFGLSLYTDRQTLQTRVGDCQLTYAYTKDDNAERTLETVKEVFAYCQSKFGAYPYPTFTLLQTTQAGDVYGYTAFCTVAEHLTERERTRAIVKQVVKQWFGEIVGIDLVHNAWQSDGIAEYVALTFFEEKSGYGVEKEKEVMKCLREYRSYYDVYGSVLDRTDTKMTKPLSEYVNAYEYRCISVNKAVVMLDTLQKSIGEKRLFAGLKRYCTQYAFVLTGEAELIGALENHGADVQGFFDGFLQGKVIL
ncbi:MAG: hypothetical protein IJ996_06600 [Clostridia bacterium]|nr:hypothetical protein [Clostridia bacterium]